MVRILALVCACALIGIPALTSASQAADRHHAGHDKLGKRIQQNGKHEIHRTTNHAIHAHVKGKKVTGLTATHHKSGKQTKLTKYKSTRKLHAQLDNPNGDTGLVSTDTEEVSLTVWIG